MAPPRHFGLNRRAIPTDNGGMHDYDLICVGCGPAGEKAATQASYYGFRVAIVERNVRPGGAMVNTGTIPSKSLRETALLCSAFHRRPLPGMNFRVDHAFSMNKFMARRHLIEAQEHDRIEASFDRHGITVVHGEGRLVDPHTVAVTDANGHERTISASNILITTGSSPLRPDHIPFDDRNVVEADSILTLDHVPSSLVIVGGGVIGTEYASMFAEIETSVTLVHHGAEILSFLDGECRERLVSSMKRQGVNFVLETTVDAVKVDSFGSVRVSLSNGEKVEADTLLWAAGRQSNTRGIGLEEVGVAMGDRGLILVDEQYRTSIPSIRAAGDVIGFPALAATSMEQGRIAACSMFNIDFKTKLASTTPIGIYSIPAISMVGKTPEQARAEFHDIVIGRAEYRYNVRGRMLGDEEGLLKCVFDRHSRELLGATIIGEDATELIHLAQSAISHHAGIDYFINACFNYPSLAELFKYAAYSALQAMAREDAGEPASDHRATAA